MATVVPSAAATASANAHDRKAQDGEVADIGGALTPEGEGDPVLASASTTTRERRAAVDVTAEFVGAPASAANGVRAAAGEATAAAVPWGLLVAAAKVVTRVAATVQVKIPLVSDGG
ncbi:hypothetical protein MMPV_006448 [Pyropia vietnamensis]